MRAYHLAPKSPYKVIAGIESTPFSATVVLCNVKWIKIRIVIEQKKTVIHPIYFPASSHLIYCL